MYRLILCVICCIVLVNSETPELQSGFSPQSAPFPSSVSTAKNNNQEIQILENPSYDPNLYTSFVPQDAIQQYVSQYGGPFPPSHYPTYTDPAGFSVQSGYEGYLVPQIPNTLGSVGHHYPGYDLNGDSVDVTSATNQNSGGGGFGSGIVNGLSSLFGSRVGSGLEVGDPYVGVAGYNGDLYDPEYEVGYDSVYGNGVGSTLGSLGTALGFYGVKDKHVPLFKSLLPLPKTVFALLLKAGSIILSSFSVIFFGGIITYLVCTFTTVCSFQLQELPFLGWTKTVTDATTNMVTDTIQGVEVTSDRVKRAAAFVRNAIERYQQLQNRIRPTTPVPSTTTASTGIFETSSTQPSRPPTARTTTSRTTTTAPPPDIDGNY